MINASHDMLQTSERSLQVGPPDQQIGDCDYQQVSGDPTGIPPKNMALDWTGKNLLVPANFTSVQEQFELLFRPKDQFII